MSRPSKSDEQRLAGLEGVSALLDKTQASAGILAVRLRQIQRRAPDATEKLELADQELARLVDSCDDAQELLAGVLAADQETRSRQGG